MLAKTLLNAGGVLAVLVGAGAALLIVAVGLYNIGFAIFGSEDAAVGFAFGGYCLGAILAIGYGQACEQAK